MNYVPTLPRPRALLLLVLAIPVAGCGHAPAMPPAAESPGSSDLPTTSVTHFAEGLELFMEHPYAVVGEGTITPARK